MQQTLQKLANYIHTHADGAILSRQYPAGRVDYLQPLIHTYPRNSNLGLVWKDDEEEEDENEVDEEQEEW